MDEKLRHDRLVLIIVKGADAIKVLAKWCAVAFVAYQAQLAIAHMSGKTTISEIAIKIWGSFPFTGIAVSSALMFLLWGMAERRLRMRKGERLTSRVVQLEEALDQYRSSSNLTSTGQTRPEDK